MRGGAGAATANRQAPEAWPTSAARDRIHKVDQPSYEVRLEADPDGGFVAVIPAFPGCYGQGETAAEALANAQAAITLTIEDMRAHGEQVPVPSRAR